MAGRAALPRAQRRSRPLRARRSPELSQADNRPIELAAPGEPPDWFRRMHGGVGPETEWMVWWALERLGKKHGVDFEYQAPAFGGRQYLGGAVVDFLLKDIGIGINPVGLFWHYYRGYSKLSKDRLLNDQLLQQGIRVIYIDEDDLRRDALFYVADALRGIDHSRIAKGFN